MFSVSKTVSDETLNCIITIESGGRVAVKAPTSSATGLGQFLKPTWLGLVHKHRPDLFDGRSEDQVLALRTDPQIAVEMLARFTEDNQRIVGMHCTGGDLYLAHFLGAQAAQRVYAAKANDRVEPLVGEAAVNANKSILLGKTAIQVRAWAAKRMADSGGHDWVAKYWSAPAAEPVPEERPEDIPDTQDVPNIQLPSPPIERRDPVPPVTPAAPETAPTITPEADEGFLDWIKRRAKTITGWISGGGGGIGLVSYFTDWRIAAVVVCGLIVAGTIAFLFYLLMRKK